MTKQDVIDAIVKQTKVAIPANIAKVLIFLAKTSNFSCITGFGTFEVRERAARKGINPRTKQEIKIPASKYPAFKPGKGLKDVIG